MQLWQSCIKSWIQDIAIQMEVHTGMSAELHMKSMPQLQTAVLTRLGFMVYFSTQSQQWLATSVKFLLAAVVLRYLQSHSKESGRSSVVWRCPTHAYQ